MLDSKRHLRKWCVAIQSAALVVAALGVLPAGTMNAARAQQPADARPPVEEQQPVALPPAHPTPRIADETNQTVVVTKPSAEQLALWHKAILKVATPKAACYTAKYPNLTWTVIACKTPPHTLYMPRRPNTPRPQQVGGQSAADFVATVTSNMTEAEGSFDSMSGVTSECDLACANQICSTTPSCSGQPSNSFSLQLNTQPMSGTAACGSSPSPSTCQGWEQFVYSQTQNCSGCTGDTFIQYWLLNFGPTGTACPAPAASASTCASEGVVSGQWCSFQFSRTGPVFCVMNAANSVGPPTEGITFLNELELTGSAPGGGNPSDSITVWEGGIPYRVTGSNTFPDLASLWRQSEFNVFGNGNGSEAVFNSGANIHVRNGVTSSSTTGPGCVVTSFTGESNTLTLVKSAPAAVVGDMPALLWSENTGAASGATCADATSVGDSLPTPTPVSPTIVSVTVTIATGNDDARSDDEIQGTINGEPAFCLKPSNNANSDGVCNNGGSARDQNGNQSWNNFTSSGTQSFPLVTPQLLSSISTLTIKLFEHNSGFETDDNWDIQGLTVTLTDSNGGAHTVINVSNPANGSNCIARLKGSPNATAAAFGLNGTASHTYVDGQNGEPGESTTCQNNGG